MDIGTTAGLSQFTTHLFVKSRHHRLSCVVLQVLAIANGNGCTVWRANSKHIDSHASGLSILSGLNSTSLMILTIGNHNDGLADTLLLCKAIDSHIDGSSNIGALCRYHRRRYATQEHLRTDIVAGNGQLNESITGKDNQTDLIVGKVVDKILNHHFRAV